MAMSTLDKLAVELGKIISPLSKATSSPEQAKGLVEALGWQLPPGIRDIGLIGLDPTPVIDKLQAISDATHEEEQDDLLMAVRSGELLAAVSNFLRAVDKTVAAISSLSGVLGDYLNKTQIKEEFLSRLLDYLIVEYISRHYYGLYVLLQFLGIFELEAFLNDPSVYQVRHVRRKVYYHRIGILFSDPTSLPKEAYGWGTANTDIPALLVNLANLLQSLGAQAAVYNMRQRVEEQLLGRPVPEAASDPMPELYITLLQGFGLSDLNVGLSAFGMRPSTSDSTDAGIAVVPFANDTTSLTFTIFPEWNLEIDSSLDLKGGVALVLRPDKSIEVQSGLESQDGTSVVKAGKLVLRVRYEDVEKKPFQILSLPGGSVLNARSLHLGCGAGLVSSNNFDFFIEGGIKEAHFALDPSKGDGFISTIIPKEGFEASFDLTVGVSRQQGLYFQGSGALELKLNVHVVLGPIEVDAIYIRISSGNGDKIPLELSSAVSVKLGPLQAVVDRLGVKAEFGFPSSGGNLGPLDLALGFKPPSGVGLSIDASAVKGGGFLRFDPEKEEYTGALELVISNFINAKAFGLITTKMPDGSKGFSLLIIITAEFNPPYQLGYGFTLMAVGGLLGLERTVLLEPLRDGMRTGAANNIMFPVNVVQNAPRIISDLRSFFPPYEGIFLIGPMAKIGWGTPNLVTLSLGIIIQIPGDVAILGVLKVALPNERAALLRLQANFIGAIEFDKKHAWFYASLFDSRVLTWTIEGQMGVLVAWGDDANFVVSVGGFHPEFNPPPLPFPEPNRIAVSILNESWAKIRVEGYFAVTSNTAQFGARAELYFGVSAFSIDGHLAFDALFQFSPFYFIIQISSSLSVKVFGIGLFSVSFRGSLEGPTPWHVEGTGSISILWWDIDVDFSHTWGQETDTTLPPIEVMPLLKAEYEKLENWRAELPASNRILVSLRKIDITDGLVLHPVGTLKISQRAVPLGLTIDKVGSQKPSDANYFTLSVDTKGVDAEEIEIEKKDDVKEMFAMAQFKDMADSKKLSAPAFVRQNGGLELSVKGEQLNTSCAVKRMVRYELIIIDSNYKRFVKPFYRFIGLLFKHFLKGSAVTKSPLSNKYKKQNSPFEEKIRIMPDQYAVAFNSDNSPFNEEAGAFASYAEAEEFMNQKVNEDPNLKDSLHVIPQVEIKRAA